MRKDIHSALQTLKCCVTDSNLSILNFLLVACKEVACKDSVTVQWASVMNIWVPVPSPTHSSYCVTMGKRGWICYIQVAVDDHGVHLIKIFHLSAPHLQDCFLGVFFPDLFHLLFPKMGLLNVILALVRLCFSMTFEHHQQVPMETKMASFAY